MCSNLVVADDLSGLFMLDSCRGKRSTRDGLRVPEDIWGGLDCSVRETDGIHTCSYVSS